MCAVAPAAVGGAIGLLDLCDESGFSSSPMSYVLRCHRHDFKASWFCNRTASPSGAVVSGEPVSLSRV